MKKTIYLMLAAMGLMLWGHPFSLGLANATDDTAQSGQALADPSQEESAAEQQPSDDALLQESDGEQPALESSQQGSSQETASPAL